MIENVLYETPYVEQLYTEYLTQINRYQNQFKGRIFCRYYNMNKNASDYNTNTATTFDRYNSGIVYNIYDYTPLFSIYPIINESINDESTIGQRFIANSQITTYTIKEPKIEDLVVFNNNPLDGSEIYRVSSIRSSINAMHSNPNSYWFQSGIEYANIVDLSKIHVLNHYVYNLTLEKYLLQEDFIRFVNNLDKFSKILKIFEKNYFDNYQELYFCIINNNKYFPKYENQKLYNFLVNKNLFKDQFNTIKRPYSVNSINEYELKCDCENTIFIDYYNNKKCKIDINNLDENLCYDIFDISDMIDQWIWYENYEKYPYECPKINFSNIKVNNKNKLLYNGNVLVNVRQLPTSIIEATYGCL